MTYRGLFAVFASFAGIACGQNAGVSGLIQDPSKSPISGAEVNIRNEQTGGRRYTSSNTSGFYSLPSLSPGEYRLSIRAAGFETIVRENIRLEVGESARLDFILRLGDVRTEVTVTSGPPLMKTEDASVGTVIDRDIIEQMPLNGRGIQTLIELTPGVVATPVVDASRGQFAVNGQRSDANYYTVDGVSANFSAGDAPSVFSFPYTHFSLSQSGGGTLPANNFLGTFSNLVTPDALQEFRIETSTFTPEYGRSPGAQIGLVTRSGTNRYSASLFEYFRNDKTDANDWFANRVGLPRPPLRFNDFGGTFGGPVRIPHLYNGHDRTFFFLSIEDLPMVQPQPPSSYSVPTLQARQNAPPLAASLLNAYPLPNRSSNPDSSDPATTGISQFVAAYSLQQNEQSYGIRLDHSFTNRLTSFIRYSRAPSERLAGFSASGGGIASNVERYMVGTETLTAGLTQTLTAHVINELRLNGSRQSADVREMIYPIGGAKAPPDSLLFPAGYSSRDSLVLLTAGPLPSLSIGFLGQDRARQMQFVDNLSLSRGTHLFKFGVDYRWFSPVEVQPRATSLAAFNGVYGPGGIYGGAAYVEVFSPSDNRVAFVATAFSSYAQDTWRVNKRLSVTYGMRWEVDPAPRVKAGQANILGGLSNLNDVSTAYVLPPGKPFYATSWTNIAPRLGAGWTIRENAAGKTVLRAGAGRFFDLGQGGFEDSIASKMSSYEYINQPLGAIATGSPSQLSVVGRGGIVGIAPATGYNVPAIWEWNVTLEQSIGQQTLSAGYIGASGHRLTTYVTLPADSGINVVGDNGSSSYNALQLQFNRRLFKRIGLLLSYTWSHSIDNISTDVEELGVDVTVRSLAQYYNPNLNRGPSDFDIRHSLNGSIMLPLPSPRNPGWAIPFRNWSANSIFFARSALPTDILSSNSIDRPNLVAGHPLYLYGAGYPGGKRYNDAAFADPPDGEQGDLGRNALRGFGAWQVDFALHRTFQVSERVSLQLRAETFNLFNHPNFANPSDAGDPVHLTVVHNSSFGSSTSMLATGLSSTGVPGQLNPLFQIGGPRSMQFALRLRF